MTAAAFTTKTRSLIKARADRRCEACGIYTPEGYGQCQHRVARGMGGSRNPVLGSAVNGAWLCGTSASGCHGLCEVRDQDMHRRGFWLWSYENPETIPVTLHSGVKAWLAPDGTYSYETPEEAA